MSALVENGFFSIISITRALSTGDGLSERDSSGMSKSPTLSFSNHLLHVLSSPNTYFQISTVFYEISTLFIFIKYTMY